MEKEGTICALDMYVFETVCKDIRRWLDYGMNPVRVSVNFSKLHFKEDNFADRILEIIHRQGIPAKCIEIELTEASGFENFDNFVIPPEMIMVSFLLFIFYQILCQIGSKK